MQSHVHLIPTPTKIPLNSLDDVRREMARVYREARARKLDTAEASKLSFMLQGLAKLLEATVIERRLSELEAESGIHTSALDYRAPSRADSTDGDVTDVEEVQR